MKLRKIISAAVSAAMCAGMLSGMAVTANAAETTLSYYSGETALTDHQYSAETVTYTLDEAQKALLSSAKDGDTLTITYDIESNGTAKYRAGIQLYGQQFCVNCHTESGINKTSKGVEQFIKSDVCHMNGRFEKDNSSYQTAHVSYVFELNEGGTVKTVKPTLTDGGSKSVGYSIQDISSTNKQVDEIVLNSIDRGSGSFDNNFAKLSNFKAVLSVSGPEITPALPYSYETDQALENPDAKGFTAEIAVADGKSVSGLTWYIKDGGHDYKELVSGELPKITSANIRIGLVVYNIPETVDAATLEAGYTVTIE